MSLKIVTIVGTRPEVIKLCRVIHELDKHTHHILVHTGQNHDYELNEIFFRQLEIRKPDYFLSVVGGSVAQTIGNVITRSDEVFATEKPDAVLILGDTNSCLSVIAAKRRKIPLFHMEAGNRCFDQRVPEEINRRIIDHVCDINLTYTEHARRYLLAEGLRPDMIIKTGSPMKEVLVHYLKNIEASEALERLDVIAGKYFLVSAHREENVDSDENLTDLLESLNAVAEKFGWPLIFSTHPRTLKRLEAQTSLKLNPLIRFLKPLGFFEYIKLQMNAACVISDSGTISEESSILNFPAVTIRRTHERPEGMDEGTLIMCGLQVDGVINAITVVLAQYKAKTRVFRLVPDYDSDSVSQKVVRIILSYTDYVNRVVWGRCGPS